MQHPLKFVAPLARPPSPLSAHRPTRSCDIMTHVTVCLTSTPASLGDTRRDSPEELAERHERVIASALAAAGALLAALDDAAAESAADVTPAAGAVPAAAAAAADVRAALDEIVSTPGFFKRTVGAKSDIVRRAAYGLVAAVARRAAELLCGDHAATAAGAVFGALQVSAVGACLHVCGRG